MEEPSAGVRPKNSKKREYDAPDEAQLALGLPLRRRRRLWGDSAALFSLSPSERPAGCVSEDAASSLAAPDPPAPRRRSALIRPWGNRGDAEQKKAAPPEGTSSGALVEPAALRGPARLTLPGSSPAPQEGEKNINEGYPNAGFGPLSPRRSSVLLLRPQASPTTAAEPEKAAPPQAKNPPSSSPLAGPAALPAAGCGLNLAGLQSSPVAAEAVSAPSTRKNRRPLVRPTLPGPPCKVIETTDHARKAVSAVKKGEPLTIIISPNLPPARAAVVANLVFALCPALNGTQCKVLLEKLAQHVSASARCEVNIRTLESLSMISQEVQSIVDKDTAILGD